MPKHRMSWLVRWIFWTNLSSPLCAWLRLRLWEASPRFLCRQGGFHLSLPFYLSPESECLCIHQPPIFSQVSLHFTGSSWQNQVLQWDWQSYCYAHGGWCKWLALSLPWYTTLIHTWRSLLWPYFFICGQLFSDVAYKARDREDLIAGVDEFLDEVIVLPPGEWDPKIRIEPPKKVPSAEMRHVYLTTRCNS